MTPRTIRRLKPISLPPPVRLLFDRPPSGIDVEYIQRTTGSSLYYICMYPSALLPRPFTPLLDSQADIFAAVCFPANS